MSGPRLAEAEWKLARLDELSAQGRLPRTLLLGASVLDADIDPATVERVAPHLGPVFNACLSGSETGTLSAWWQIIGHVVQPAQVAIEVHPLMVHGQTSSMAAAVNAVLDRLVTHRRPAGARPLRGESALSTQRNQLNGHLHRFQDLPFEEGIKVLPPDWYEVIGIDPRPQPDFQRYLDVARTVQADVANVLLTVSPLALDSTSSTAGGHDSYRHYGDAIVAEGPSWGFPVLDLRPHFRAPDDFADPFHLRAHAVVAASTLVAESLDRHFCRP